MTYRTDKFAVGDKVEWTEEGRKSFAYGYGEGPFTVTKVDEAEDIMWPAMGHTQFVHFNGTGVHLFSGYHFQKVKTEPSEEEIRAVALGEIARRLAAAKTALNLVLFEYDLRKGFISADTMRDVTRALALLK